MPELSEAFTTQAAALTPADRAAALEAARLALEAIALIDNDQA